jgi:hypothetical protein
MPARDRNAPILFVDDPGIVKHVERMRPRARAAFAALAPGRWPGLVDGLARSAAAKARDLACLGGMGEPWVESYVAAARRMAEQERDRAAGRADAACRGKQVK